MRKIRLEAKSTTLSRKDLWRMVTNIGDYPSWCKFCQRIFDAPTKIEEGSAWIDITTLLWIPIKVKHIVTRVKLYEEFYAFLPLPGGGKMWFQFSFEQKGKDSYMNNEIMFDLGNRFINSTVGYVLEKRWIQLLRQGFPGLDEKNIYDKFYAKIY